MAVVYILRNGDEDLFKIGRAGDLDERLKDHHTSNPSLEVFRVIEAGSRAAAAACEAYLKGVLQSRRHHSAGTTTEFFALPPAEVEAAAQDAQRYLEEDLPARREADRLAGEASDGTMLTPGDEEWEAWRRLLVVREDRCRTGAEEKRLENRLKAAIGTAAGLEGVATWRTQVSRKFSEAEFRAANPEVWEAFRRESPSRRFDVR